MGEFSIFFGIVFFIFGTVFGSFFNVLIYRIPHNLSIIKPASYCTNCGKKLKWYMNIPILSYVFLKGRCAYCNFKISIQYPLVEAMSGLIFLSGYLLYGISLTTADYILFTCTLFIISVIDFKHFIIPISILIPAFLWRIFFNIKTGQIWMNLLGLVAGFGFVYFLMVFGEKIFKKEAMGGGDVYYTGFIGFFIGIKLMVLMFLIASLTGVLFGLVSMLLDKLRKKEVKMVIPFGPFLSLGALIAYLWGAEIIKWYLALCGVTG